MKGMMFYEPLRPNRIVQMTSRYYRKQIIENRLLITLDEHFGDWVILPLSKHPGVVRIKVYPTTSERILTLLMPFLREHTQVQFRDHLVILSEKRAKWIHTA